MSTMIKSAAAAAAIVVATMMSASSFAADAAKSVVGTPTANRYTQALVDRMDSDKSGKVSKAEYMKFMEAEWNALDKDKNGVLETTEYMNREYFAPPAGGAASTR